MAMKYCGTRIHISVNPAQQPSATTSTVATDCPEFAATSANEPSAAGVGMPMSNEQEPVRLLLDRLTGLHDFLQRDGTVRWNELLPAARKEDEAGAAAAAAAAADRSLQFIDTPAAGSQEESMSPCFVQWPRKGGKSLLEEPPRHGGNHSSNLMGLTRRSVMCRASRAMRSG